MEKYEVHKELFDLPQYTFPICLLVFGYPTPQQMKRPYTKRFPEKFILFENHYHRLNKQELTRLFAERERQRSKVKSKDDITNFGQAIYFRKFDSDFSREMNRSVKMILKVWLE